MLREENQNKDGLVDSGRSLELCPTLTLKATITESNNWIFFDWSGTLIARLATNPRRQNASTNYPRAVGVNECHICSNHFMCVVYRAVISFHKTMGQILVSHCVSFESTLRRQGKFV